MEFTDIEKVLILIQNYRFASALIFTLLVIFLWKTRIPLRAIPIAIQIFQGKKGLDDLVWAIAPTQQMYGSARMAFVFDSKIVPRDCNDLKMKLTSLLRKCRSRQEALTVSFARIEQISPQAIDALELFAHNIVNKYSDIIIKIILPKHGQCPDFDNYIYWLNNLVNIKNAQNVTIVTDRSVEVEENASN